MKYSEYQVWYHTYNKSITSLIKSRALPIHELINMAKQTADMALNVFNTVEDLPQTPNLDLQELMNKVIKDSNKRK